MKKLFLLLLTGLFVIGCSNEVFSQTKLEKKQQKAKAKSASKIVKQLTKEGWELATKSKTLEEAVLDHKVALEKDENNYEIIGYSNGSSATGPAHIEAIHNACITYASLAKKSVLRGVENSNIGHLNEEELNNFVGAYERLVSGTIEKELVESFSIYRRDANGKLEFQTYFIVNEVKAGQVRMRAMQTAIEEAKLSEDFSKTISGIVKEAFDPEGE